MSLGEIRACFKVSPVRPFNRVNDLSRELACVFLRHMDREHVHGAVEHARGDLGTADIDSDCVWLHDFPFRC